MVPCGSRPRMGLPSSQRNRYGSATLTLLAGRQLGVDDVRNRVGGVVGIAAAAVGASVGLAPAAQAGGVPAWNGPYAVSAYTGTYTFLTDCSSGDCVATIIDGSAVEKPCQGTVDIPVSAVPA